MLETILALFIVGFSKLSVIVCTTVIILFLVVMIPIIIVDIILALCDCESSED